MERWRLDTVLDPLGTNALQAKVNPPLYQSMLFINPFINCFRLPIAMFSKYPQQNLLGVFVKNADSQGTIPRSAEPTPLAMGSDVLLLMLFLMHRKM